VHCSVATFLKVDYVDAMISLARVLQRSKQPRQPSSMNRSGFSLKSLTTKDGSNGARANFLCELTAPQNIRAVLTCGKQQREEFGFRICLLNINGLLEGVMDGRSFLAYSNLLALLGMAPALFANPIAKQLAGGESKSVRPSRVGNEAASGSEEFDVVILVSCLI